jgi:hypothetical protein
VPVAMTVASVVVGTSSLVVGVVLVLLRLPARLSCATLAISGRSVVVACCRTFEEDMPQVTGIAWATPVTNIAQ